MAGYDITDPLDINIGGEPWQPVTIEVEVTEHHSEAMLLGPDGHPLQYEPPQRVGFDLTPRFLTAE